MSAKPRKILFIGAVFPEPTSSAAGVRTFSLLEDFISRGDQILFVSPSDQNAFSEALKAKGIQTEVSKPNDPAFDSLVAEFKPDVAVFDRFMLEEQFGWRVAAVAPNALRILDTIDLHFMRRIRGDWLASELKGKEGASVSDEVLTRLFHSLDGIETEDCLRELASIYRSDLTLILSSFEMSLLTNRFQIPRDRLLELGFSYSTADRAAWMSYPERKHFVSIGNFRHLPNRDSAFWMARSLWPKIRAELEASGHSGVELHLYGAYPPKEIMALENEKQGIRVLGPAEDSIPTLAKYRSLLAPIRFGAGIKGKIADAWAAGIPVVTTPLGAEGMTISTGDFAGMVSESESEFVRDAVEVYSHPEVSELFREAGVAALDELYHPERNREAFLSRIDQCLENLDAHRSASIVTKVLMSDTQGRAKYLSKWIEEKNKKGATA